MLDTLRPLSDSVKVGFIVEISERTNSDLEMEGGELRRSVTLSEQLSIVASSSLGELLKRREEEETRLSRCADDVSVTLESIMAWEKMEGSDASGGSTGRTLLDIILQEHEMSAGIMTEGNTSSAAAWKSLRDHFHLNNPGATCGAASPDHPRPMPGPELVGSANPNPLPASPSDSTHNYELAVPGPTAPVASASEGAVDSSAPAAAPEEEEEGSEESSARVSLMALLEQTDRQWAGSGSEGLSQVAAVAEEDEEGMPGDGVMCMCCVCMVRHKGAAFIPCGHTFCRICSRELWVTRGTCPLCNGNISEILDIF